MLFSNISLNRTGITALALQLYSSFTPGVCVFFQSKETGIIAVFISQLQKEERNQTEINQSPLAPALLIADDVLADMVLFIIDAAVPLLPCKRLRQQQCVSRSAHYS